MFILLILDISTANDITKKGGEDNISTNKFALYPILLD